MGNCFKATGEEGQLNAKVEKRLKASNDDVETKVLLLGSGESGKSTIFKQMRIIHKEGFNEEERALYTDVILANILRAMKNLVAASLQLGIPVEIPENREKAQQLNALDSQVLLNIRKVWNSDFGDDIKSLWEDPGIKKTFARRSEFQIDDSAEYYFNDLDRINKPNYLPSEQDVLRSRVKTTGIVETDFKIKGKAIRMIDVGGQRNERKKWIHCFEGVTAIIFVCALSEYDQKCYEDNTTNRMQESLLLFDEICNCRWFEDTNIILFLNKSDLFQDKIKNPLTTLSKTFPNYTGGDSFDSGVSFIKEKYLSVNKNKDKKTIYSHVTCATDTDNIQKVFDSIQAILLSSSLKENGLIF